MDSKDIHLHDGKKGATLAVRVIPRASKNEIVEIMDNGIVKIRLTAPPVEGKANDALIKFLAKLLDVSIKQLKVVAGASGRNKMISVTEMDANTLRKKLLEHIG